MDDRFPSQWIIYPYKPVSYGSGKTGMYRQMRLRLLPVYHVFSIHLPSIYHPRVILLRGMYLTIPKAAQTTSFGLLYLVKDHFDTIAA